MSKQKAVAYVVGDRFKNFTCNENIFSLTKFMKILKTEPESLQGMLVLPGQGLSFESMRMIEDTIANRGLQDQVIYRGLDTKLFDRKYVHKHKDYNVLLSYPTQITKDLYLAQLLIDERCADISDHMTGQHVQGMVLTEAARQMFIGVTEAYIVSEEQIGNTVYIFNKIDVEFVSFIFPLPVEVRYIINERVSKKGTSIHFKVTVEFYQNENLSASAYIEFTTYDADFIKSVEGKKAQQSVDMALAPYVSDRSLPIEEEMVAS